ncbi:MAG: hypothetical protein M3P51_16185 [Chloroflexota bacterium]|nr:hypothetical protein [Chloroflexota bacterium]
MEDSGWVEIDDILALIGENRSGKTNLLMPRWKLNPANEGEIGPIADYPRSRYNDIQAMDPKPVLIEAHFELEDDLAQQLARIIHGCDLE